MTRPANPPLTPGRVYRTRELGRWSANPSRLAKRLVRTAAAVQVGPGMYARLVRTRWGDGPPPVEQLLRAFLGGGAYLLTGSVAWNALDLGSTQVLPVQLVYNTKRSGRFVLGGIPFWLRRKPFPRKPALEWFVIDLLENQPLLGIDGMAVRRALSAALRARRFEVRMLLRMARTYGSRDTVECVIGAVAEAGA